MQKLIFNRHLMKRTQGAFNLPLKYETQIGQYGCWASAAWMVSGSPVNCEFSDSAGLAVKFLEISQRSSCAHQDCVVCNHGGIQTYACPDSPLCLQCNLKILKFVCSTVSWKKTDVPKRGRYEWVVAKLRESRPLEAYCSNGADAHYSVIYGYFDLKLSETIRHYLMVADPWERGTGVCEFSYFLSDGRYGRSKTARKSLRWVASFHG